MSRNIPYRGYYFRFNSFKDCYEIGKYVRGKWELQMTCDRNEDPKKEIDDEIKRLEELEKNG